MALNPLQPPRGQARIDDPGDVQPQAKQPDPPATQEPRGAPDRVQGQGNRNGAGAPVATQPMDGAFTGSAARTRPTATRQPDRPWTGPTITAADLNEPTERRLLREAGRDCVIASYGDFDPNRPPVVLVHGIDGSGADLDDMAERLQSEGKQVFVAFYRDRGRRTHDSGQALARELSGLRERHYNPGTPLDIVAHSMGGIVTRAALNQLQNPGWMGEASEVPANPRAGFGPIRVRTADTPWDGFGNEPEIPVLGPIIRAITQFFMWLAGWLGAFDMRGNSEMFQNLYEDDLEGVDIRNMAARQAGEQDSIRALPDLSQEELSAVRRAILEGTRPEGHQARNMFGSLRQDARYEQLQSELRAALRDIPADDSAAQNRALVAVYERVMPRFEGTHVSVLRDDPNRTNDLVDHVARSLRAPPSSARRS